MSEAQRRRELRKQNRLLVRQESLAARDVEKVIRTMADEVADRVTYGAVDPSLEIVDTYRERISGALEKRLQQTAMIFGERELDRLTGLMPKSYYPNLAPGTGPVRGRDFVELEGKSAREIFERAVRRWVLLHALDRATTITATLRKLVRGVLIESFADGTGEAGTVKLIRERIGRAIAASNAARIARTEMHTAANVGADEAARSTGLEMVKEWASAEDSRTRKSHATADGQTVRMDEAFNVGGTALMFPGDPAGPAKEIINCRCTALHWPVIGGEVIR